MYFAVYTGIDLLALSAILKQAEAENQVLQEQIAVVSRKLRLAQEKKATVSMSTQTEIYDGNFSIENVRDSKLKGLFKYYTEMTYVMFVTLFSFLVTPGNKAIEYESQRSDILKVDIENQLFLVLCRLRKGFQIKDLACRFNIGLYVQCVSTLFNSWIKHIYLKLGYLSWWPSRNVIFDNMPQNYKYDFPTSMAIIDCTEIKTETPSSLKSQSQCFSDYKSSTTLKSFWIYFR